jgi:ribosomal protein S18 acetylase RimI-like enzyme
MHLRTATPADAPAIRDLTCRAYAAWVPVIGREPRPMTADYDAAVRDHRFDLYESESGLIALIETERRADHLFIVNIAVDPGEHGRGLGQALLAHAETLAAEASLAEVRLTTNQLMARNVRIYQRAGYAITRLEPIADGMVVHMTKALA